MNFTLNNNAAKKLALTEMNRMLNEVSFAKDFHKGLATDREYYKRHLIETILRIRLNNEVDSYCLYKIGYKNNRLAVLLAQYLSEEIGHDGYFIKDLNAFDIDEPEIYNTKPLFATEKLIGYMYHIINQEGPMITMVWNWFVELYSDTYNTVITNKASQEFGEIFSEGFKEHIEFDEGHDHVGLMFKTVEACIENVKDYERLSDYIIKLVGLVGEYFQELYDLTIKNKSVAKAA